MPSYAYRCTECGTSFDRTEHISDHGHTAPQCPACRSARTQQVPAPFFAKTSRKS
jgi:putative FmdB family regulatory protein